MGRQRGGDRHDSLDSVEKGESMLVCVVGDIARNVFVIYCCNQNIQSAAIRTFVISSVN